MDRISRINANFAASPAQAPKPPRPLKAKNPITTSQMDVLVEPNTKKLKEQKQKPLPPNPLRQKTLPQKPQMQSSIQQNPTQQKPQKSSTIQPEDPHLVQELQKSSTTQPEESHLVQEPQNWTDNEDTIILDEEMPLVPETEPDMTEDVLKTKRKNIFRKMFQSRKKLSVRTRDQKIRRNRKLRKAIIPKNAAMSLLEMPNVTVSKCTFTKKALGAGHTALITVNDIQYMASGISQNKAKNNVCEKAFRDIVLHKMAQQTKCVPAGAIESNESDKKDDNEVSILNLTSFAVYKLLDAWEREGFEIPDFHVVNNTNSIVGASKISMKQRSELPSTWAEMHPCSLLLCMRPDTVFNCINEEGFNPNNMHRCSIVCDEKEFIGYGRSKKIAKRNVAATICNQLFSTDFAVDVVSALSTR